MKISTEIASLARIVGMEKAVELCAKAGFDAWDFSMFTMCQIDWGTWEPLHNPNELNGPHYLEFAQKLRKVGEENGIVCNQSHAPFPVEVPAILAFQRRALECTAAAGGKICIIHPSNNKTAEENAEMYGQLLPYAKSLGVKIATENMWNWDKEKDESCFAACASAEDFVKHVDVMNDPDFVACLDLGHAEMRGAGDGAVHMIHKLGHRLQALHIHDNDCWHDSHQIPFSMNMDFEPIVKALKDIRYQGYFTLEADAFLRAYNKDNVFEGVQKLADSAKRLADMYEAM